MAKEATDYDGHADEYMGKQNKFYSERQDESRGAIYSQLDFPLKGKKVLDAGCGFGKDLVYLHGKGAEVYGIDLSRQMIELARKQNPDLRNLSVQSYENTDFGDGFFDVIISRYAICYSKKPEKVFRELHRILKPGGYLIVLVAHPLLCFVAKSRKDYHKQEIVNIPIYEKGFVVTKPSNTFSDYLSDFLLSKFEMLGFHESSGLENRSFKEKVPDFFLIKLRKN